MAANVAPLLEPAAPTEAPTRREHRQENNGERHPCLDGLRGLSILLVLISHTLVTPMVIRLDPPQYEIGVIGVRLFFILSGFLFTTLLVEERERTGTISLRKFYLRRTLRIFPAFYAYVFIIAIAGVIGWIRLRPNDLLSAITFTMNYHAHAGRAWELGHLWSLSVTEQFYVVWPATVLLFGRRGAFRAAVAALVVAPLLRLLLFYWVPSYRANIGETFETVFDALAVGALMSLLVHAPEGDRWPFFDRLLRHPITPFLALAIAVSSHLLHHHVRFSYSIGETITNVGLGLLVGSCLTRPNNPFGLFLQTRWMTAIGSISFSLYLTQQPFLNRFKDDWMTRFPMSWVLAIAFAVILHYGVELPLMRLRSRLTRRTPAPATT